MNHPTTPNHIQPTHRSAVQTLLLHGLSLMILLALAAACSLGERANPTLPPPTQRGAQTLGFMHGDGRLWLPAMDVNSAIAMAFSSPMRSRVEASVERQYEVIRTFRNGQQEVDSIFVGWSISIRAIRRRMRADTSSSITIHLQGLDTLRTGVYPLGAEPDNPYGGYSGYAWYEMAVGDNWPIGFHTDSMYTGTLTLTAIDTTADTLTGRFISGLFAFDAVGQDTATQVYDGRFDLRY